MKPALLSAMLFLFASQAFAANPERVKLVVNAVIESAHDTRVLLTFAALSGASIDTLRILKKLAPSKGTKFSIDENVIRENGKTTGMKIISYSPFNISANGKTWSYDHKRSIDENAEALQAFRGAGSKSGRLSLLFDSAWADGSAAAGVAATAGAVAQKAYDTVVGILAAATRPVTAEESVYGHVLKDMAKTDVKGIQLACNDDEASVTLSQNPRARTNQNTITISKKDNKKTGTKAGEITYYGHNSVETKTYIATEIDLAAIRNLTKCNDGNKDASAKDFLRALNSERATNGNPPAAAGQPDKQAPAKAAP